MQGKVPERKEVHRGKKSLRDLQRVKFKSVPEY